MKIKITQSQLKELIKEEANRYKRVLELQKKREEIIQQLNEMYENDFAMENSPMAPEMEEGLLDFFKKENPEQKKAELAQYVQNHPSYSQTAQHVAQTTGQSVDDVQAQLIDFLMKNATLADGQLKGVMGGISYDKTTKQFINKTKISAPYGPMSGKGEI